MPRCYEKVEIHEIKILSLCGVYIPLITQHGKRVHVEPYYSQIVDHVSCTCLVNGEM